MKVEIAFIWVIPHSFLKFKLPNQINQVLFTYEYILLAN